MRREKLPKEKNKRSLFFKYFALLCFPVFHLSQITRVKWITKLSIKMSEMCLLHESVISLFIITWPAY